MKSLLDHIKDFFTRKKKETVENKPEVFVPPTVDTITVRESDTVSKVEIKVEPVKVETKVVEDTKKVESTEEPVVIAKMEKVEEEPKVVVKSKPKRRKSTSSKKSTKPKE